MKESSKSKCRQLFLCSLANKFTEQKDMPIIDFGFTLRAFKNLFEDLYENDIVVKNIYDLEEKHLRHITHIWKESGVKRNILSQRLHCITNILDRFVYLSNTAIDLI